MNKKENTNKHVVQLSEQKTENFYASLDSLVTDVSFAFH